MIFKEFKNLFNNKTKNSKNEIKNVVELKTGKTITKSNHLKKEEILNEEIVCYFENSVLTNVFPENAPKYNSTVFIADGYKYNLLEANSVKSIPVPVFPHNGMVSVTMNEDYILRMAAVNIRKYNKDLSIQIMKKATELMLSSNISWSYNDYLRLVKWLYEDGLIEEAEKAEDYFKQNIILGNYFNNKMNNYTLEKTIDNARKLGTNILISSQDRSCSKEDAYIRNRLFSIDGKHPTLKKVPKLENHSTISFYPFFLGFSIMEDMNFNKVKDPIKYSNRPIVDDRTDKEKENYLKRISKINNEEMEWLIHKQFYYLKYKFPDICPRSRNALKTLYTRNDEEYLKLISILPSNYQVII